MSRDELIVQLPMLKKGFVDYKSYLSAVFGTIFTDEEQQKLKELVAITFETSVFVNGEQNKFSRIFLPFQAQFAPVFFNRSS